MNHLKGKFVPKDKLLLEKKNKTAGAKGRVRVAAKKLAVLQLNMKKGHLELYLCYDLLNRYIV